MKTFPDAKIVFIVRDPLETIPSYFSMQEKIRFGSIMTEQELKFYQKETYKEIIDWYKETEVAQDKLESKNFVVFTYQDLTENLEKTIKQFFTFSNQKMTKEFKKILKKTISKKYVKKHQNKTVFDFGLSDLINSSTICMSISLVSFTSSSIFIRISFLSQNSFI